MALKRPFRSEYRDSKSRMFKVGRASTLSRAIVAATRTLIDSGRRSAYVKIYNQHGVEKAEMGVFHNMLSIRRRR